MPRTEEHREEESLEAREASEEEAMTMSTIGPELEKVVPFLSERDRHDRENQREKERASWERQQRELPRTAEEARAYAARKNREAKGLRIDVVDVYRNRNHPRALEDRPEPTKPPRTFAELVASYYGGDRGGDVGLIETSARGGGR